MMITSTIYKDKTKWHINSLLNQIAARKESIASHHYHKNILTSLGHKIANDQQLSVLYIRAERELERLYSITYSVNGVIQVTKNL